MFRLTQQSASSRTTVTVDGQLAAEHLPAVETCCAQALSSGQTVDLVLRDVSAVDQDGCDLLRRLAAQGVRLRGGCIFTSYLIGLLQAPPAEPS